MIIGAGLAPPALVGALEESAEQVPTLERPAFEYDRQEGAKLEAEYAVTVALLNWQGDGGRRSQGGIEE